MTELLQPKPVGAPAAPPPGPGRARRQADAPRLDRRPAPRGRSSAPVTHLLGLQEPAGWWKGDLETNVTMDAEDLLLRQFLGIRTGEQTAATGRWIRSQQLADGAWPTFHGGPGDLSTTIEAYIGLRLAGDAPDAPHMAAAAGLRPGGRRHRTQPGLHPVLAGALRPLVLARPARGPAGAGAAAEVDAGQRLRLRLLGAADHRAARGDPARCARSATSASTSTSCAAASSRHLRRGCAAAVACCTAATASPPPTSASPWSPYAMNALRRCAEWIVARQEADGGWGGIQPPWVYSLMALHLLGYPMDHPVMKAGLDGLDGFTLHRDGPDGPVRLLEACQSPVWDTALAVVALSETGAARRRSGDDEGRAVAARRGDPGQGGLGGTPPGDPGRRLGVRVRQRHLPGHRRHRRGDDGAARVRRSRRSRRCCAPPGGCSGCSRATAAGRAFDADNTSEFLADLPFCDFGAVIDPPSADVTAHVVEALAHEGFSRTPAVRRGVALAAGAPGAGRVVVRALGRQPRLRHRRGGAGPGGGRGAGEPPGVAARGAVAADAPERRRRLGRGPALLPGTGVDRPGRLHRVADGLGAARPARRRRWATARPPTEGWPGWPRPSRPTAAGTSRTSPAPASRGDFYINYGLYRLVFPVMALGRILTARAAAVAAAETAP